MKTEKHLKYGDFLHDHKTGILYASVDDNGIRKTIILNKVYALALARFTLRILQKGWHAKKKK